ncbi:unnamed protein product [Cunninghamella blakesleeana]
MEIDDITFELYQNYIGIKTKKDLILHFNNIQQLLKKNGPSYKCIEQFKFAIPRMKYRFFYNKVLEYGKKSEQEPYLLDLGCCTGTDLRQLLIDGYASNYLIGLDNTQHFIDIGYELFQEKKEKTPISFIQYDMFQCHQHPFYQQYQHKIMVLMVGSVIHLFQSLNQIHQWFQQIIPLLKKNALLVGAHVITSNHESSITIHRRSLSSSNQLKFYLNQHDFHQLLIHYGFQQIEMITEVRDENENDHHASLCWLIYSAVYCPS